MIFPRWHPARYSDKVPDSRLTESRLASPFPILERMYLELPGPNMLLGLEAFALPPRWLAHLIAVTDVYR